MKLTPDLQHILKDYHVIEHKGNLLLFNKHNLSLLKISYEDVDSIKTETVIEQKILNENIRTLDEKNDTLTMILNAAQVCNFKCSYCFAQNNNSYCSYFVNNLNDKSDELMAVDIAEKSVDLLIRSAKQLKVEKLIVAFFGGEPLLNFSLIEKTVEYIERKTKNTGLKVFLHLGTNGFLLSNDRINYLREHNFIVTISIDGKKQVHDLHRKLPDGHGTYDVIVSNAQQAISAIPVVGVSSTFTKENNVFDTYKHLEQIGFKSIIATPVIFNGSELKLDKKAFADLIVNEKKIISYIFDKFRQNLQSSAYAVLSTNILPPLFTKCKKVRYCDAGFRLFSVSVNGDVYPCSNFTNIGGFKMGNVLTLDNITSSEVHIKFKDAIVDKRQKCSRCWARYVCGGGCYYSAYINNKTMMSNDGQNCDRMKHLIEQTLKKIADITS